MNIDSTNKITLSEAHNLAGLVEYAPGAIVSREIVNNKVGTLTVFAFDAGQGLSEHSAPFDAIVQILAGAAEWTIGGTPISCAAGEIMIMPANVPHAVKAEQCFKMLLTMIKA